MIVTPERKREAAKETVLRCQKRIEHYDREIARAEGRGDLRTATDFIHARNVEVGARDLALRQSRQVITERAGLRVPVDTQRFWDANALEGWGADVCEECDEFKQMRKGHTVCGWCVAKKAYARNGVK